MERYFILDKYNTFYDWDLIITDKEISPPEPKTNYVDIDGMSGSLDLSESLTGEITYKDRTISASFWTCTGSIDERKKLFAKILTALHGKKIKIIEPDDMDHYYYGRVKIKSQSHIIAYSEMDIEITCEPYRYALFDTVRYLAVDSEKTVVIRNYGVKTVWPIITITGSITIVYDGKETTLTDGNYKIPDIKLYSGVNTITVSGSGSITFAYREADI